jgi:hypothetical protein
MNWKTSTATVAIFVLLFGFIFSSGTSQDVRAAVLDAELTALAQSRINYQGVLEESGTRVNGSRTFHFRLFNNDTCSNTGGLGNTESITTDVSDGFFSVEVPLNAGFIDGRQIWLRVGVGASAPGEDLACNELLPVPYALSLRPGAEIHGDQPNNNALWLHNLATSGDSRALRAETNSPDGSAVYAHNLAGTGDAYGLIARSNSSNDGADILAGGTGRIRSVADSEITYTAFGMVLDPQFSSDNTAFLHSINGLGTTLVRRVNATAAASNAYAYLELPVPSPLYGATQSVKEVEICYRSDSSSAAISESRLKLLGSNGLSSNLDLDLTSYNSTTPECITLAPNSPTEVTGVLFLQLGFTWSNGNFGSSHEIGINTITVTFSSM